MEKDNYKVVLQLAVMKSDITKRQRAFFILRDFSHQAHGIKGHSLSFISTSILNKHVMLNDYLWHYWLYTFKER